MLADGNALGKGIRKQKKRLSKNLSTKKDNPFYFWVALFAFVISIIFLYLLHLAHDTEPVTAPDFLYVGCGEAAAQELAGDVAQL